MGEIVDPRVMLGRQIQLIEAGDLEGLIDQYDDEAVLVRFDRVARGKDQIRQVMEAYLERSPKLQSLDAYADSKDSLSYQATMLIAGEAVRTYGAWVLKGDKIWRQFAGLL